MKGRMSYISKVIKKFFFNIFNHISFWNLNKFLFYRFYFIDCFIDILDQFKFLERNDSMYKIQYKNIKQNFLNLFTCTSIGKCLIYFNYLTFSYEKKREE